LKARKKFLAIVSTVALAAGISMIAAPVAHAAPVPPTNNANDTVECNDIIGKIKFAVPLVLGGTTPNQVTISIKSTDCTSTGLGLYDIGTNPGGIAIKSMSAKGVLASANNDCLGLQGLSSGVSGDVTMKWSMKPQTPKVTNTSSTMTISESWGGEFNDGGVTSPATASGPWAHHNAWFAVGGTGSGRPLGSAESLTAAPAVTGGFTGGDGGATTLFMGASVESTGTLFNACLGTGLKGMTFSVGYINLK
jgi:hypothetical protein